MCRIYAANGGHNGDLLARLSATRLKRLFNRSWQTEMQAKILNMRLHMQKHVTHMQKYANICICGNMQFSKYQNMWKICDMQIFARYAIYAAIA